MQNIVRITSQSELETRAVAISIAKMLKRGDCLSVTGMLGAGKTVFVRGLAQGLGIDPERVHSPSFTVLNEYRGNPDLYHFDLYRLSSVNELTETGWDEYLSRDGIVVAEWGERAGNRLPSVYYHVNITSTGEQSREIDITLVSA